MAYWVIQNSKFKRYDVNEHWIIGSEFVFDLQWTVPSHKQAQYDYKPRMFFIVS